MSHFTVTCITKTSREDELEHLLTPYERPSCDEDCDNEFCGSPRHVNQEFNDDTYEWEDIA